MSKKPEEITGSVSRIIPFSCVDGPGNRFVIFLQGCNFSCKNCHNPHTMGICDHCGDCVPGCPSGALFIDSGKVTWNQSICENCDQCIDICPRSSSPMTQLLTVAEVITQLETAVPFLTGITVSGGESTMQLKFIRALFKTIKQRSHLQHLTCLVDSNGYLPVSGWEKLLSVMDGAMIDLKACNNDLHLWLTGRANHRVLDSIDFLYKRQKLTEVRWLAIPEITDTSEELTAISAFLKTTAPEAPLRINAFSNSAVKGQARQWQNMSSERIPLLEAELFTTS
ncbi:YjjW family glycine radical enzyme activase [Endozoicomonas sp. OPT23]|uniref:YjjW family glycine radical enzyme activase n=1 Tax=Endozoicomonas sp. OPT23 TaxID=2072845 RepID=UPI00129B4313|nr:YjjW family glycine radical enzyme activase [Endozoicomonas sp. OPT23]MRI31386.1 YjjW family glycine radical enzyme activase [Endozoicomonas sp. OPT23]